MRRRVALLTALLLGACLAQGCWNYREVETYSIVAGIAVDKGYEGYKYHLTFDIADTSHVSKDKPVKTLLIESEGDTMFEAIRNALKRTGLVLYFQNCQVVVVGREVAEESILPVLDFLVRDHEFRPTIELFVSEEGTAKEVFKLEATTMSIASFEIDKIYENIEMYNPVAAYQLLYEDYNTLAARGRELALASLRVMENMGKETVEINGMALFNKDRLIGFLTAEDARLATFVMDRVRGGVLKVKAPGGNTIAALEVFGNKTNVEPQAGDGAVRFTVCTETDASLGELDKTENVSDRDKIAGFEAAAEMQLRNEIVRVVKAVQQTGSDIFGFGEALHRSDPGAWYHLEEGWDETFRRAQVEVNCNIGIRNQGAKKMPVKAGG